MHEDEIFHDIDEEVEKGLWKTERVDFKSIGIDIGSSTTHLMVSHLVLCRRGREYYSGFTVVERNMIYESPIMFTPYLNDNYTIDAEKIARFIERSYKEAGVTPEEVDTGAVIITGEAARKENAENIINLFANQAGKFVTAIAGHNMEATLAAHGSDAVHRSSHKTKEGKNPVIMNVDIGGGTTKVAIAQEGMVKETCAINVGSRLIAWDEEGRINRLEEAGKNIAKSKGISLKTGDKITAEQKEIIGRESMELIFNVIQRKPLSPLAERLMVTPNLSYTGPVDSIIYSGGVSEYIYDKTKVSESDMGDILARYIREEEGRGLSIQSPKQRIRATVIGASQYTVQVSGSTIYLSDSSVLPLRSLPVISIKPVNESLTVSDITSEIRQSFQNMDLNEGCQTVAIAIKWDQDPSFGAISDFCSGLLQALKKTVAERLPVVLIFDGDVGGLIGHHLKGLAVNGCPIISIDNIDLRGLNYVDIGEELPDTKAVPVTVKTFVF